MGKQLNKYHALNRLQALCSKKEYCIKEIEQKLTLWNVAEQKIIIDQLVSDNFLNQTRYASAFVNDKWKIAKWGKIKINYALRQRGIGESDIRQAMDNIDSELYHKMVYHELDKKAQSIPNDVPAHFKQKLLHFGQQRGYETELLYKYIGA